MARTYLERARQFLVSHGCKEGYYIVNYNSNREITFIYHWCKTKEKALLWVQKQSPLASVYSIFANTPTNIRVAKLHNRIGLDKDLI